jgi:hypothetical protein
MIQVATAISVHHDHQVMASVRESTYIKIIAKHIRPSVHDCVTARVLFDVPYFLISVSKTGISCGPSHHKRADRMDCQIEDLDIGVVECLPTTLWKLPAFDRCRCRGDVSL